MDRLFCYIIMFFCAISINAQSLPKGINETNLGKWVELKSDLSKAITTN